MDDRGEELTYGGLTPVEALRLVGDEVRAEILFALSDAREGAGGPPVLSFSELRERVDVDVDSSQFNYHLQQLVGRFVERREPEGDVDREVTAFANREDGYALRPEGTMLTRILRSGTYTGSGELAPFPAGFDCYFCGSEVEAVYRNWLFSVRCPDCAHLYDHNFTPPGVLADDRETTLARVAAYNRHVRLGFARGVCPYCANDVGATVYAAEELGYPRADHREALVNRRCGHCGNMDYLTVGEVACREPALVAFAHEYGVDVTRTPLWDLPFAMTDEQVTVRDDDPWRLALELAPGDLVRDGAGAADDAATPDAPPATDGADPGADRLTLVFDGDLALVEATRE
jgi:hypothetical protein